MRAIILSLSLGLCLLAAACASAPRPTVDSLDAIAADYVRMQLEIGEREDGYVDAYYGPAEWAEAAKANPRTVGQLVVAAAGLTSRLNALDAAGWTQEEVQRRRYLLAHIAAADTRLRMQQGQTFSFAEEAERLFGIRPELNPLSSYDPILARIEALVPGEGAVGERIAAFRAPLAIPRDRLQTVMQAAIDECRRRTEAHIALPANESFTLTLVGDKPWSGYNYYQGGSVSKIEINADLPIYLDRAIDLGCHEGYPGHHVYNALLEQIFVTEKGWVEMSLYPLFSPMSLVAEGSANYGIDLAFPGDEAIRYQREVLAPLAGVSPERVASNAELLALTRQLEGAEYTIASEYLAGRMPRDQAIEALSRYRLMDRARATQRVAFIDTYRSYVINYGLGRDLVQRWIEAQGPDHWATTKVLLSSQILPVDLK
ncbi:hypothetical protein E4M02_04880 [Brevundimonas sp. S30B]|uniref:hypothetical protein n=1 Tax=unclassified Brevundimonas TaxID=2622653 RepID=UPI0010729A7C|nr:MULTISPECIES: hypothetical protein [unclassified Brevundimonas]QBX36797.1 hypothetical protein E4M01_02935 [Brevundimonas sp. MF30-B]TFW04408.1 hypothetical protein E4M02_04880 [Brevundimonas sp. S30B]